MSVSVTKNMNILMNVNIILIILWYFHYSNDCLPIEHTDFPKVKDKWVSHFQHLMKASLYFRSTS